MNEKREKEIIEEIERGYDKVAKKFSQTRRNFWPSLNFTKNLVKNGDKILDFGCGNGRLLSLFESQKIEYYGVDVSAELINLAKEKYAREKVNFQKISSGESLPFPNDFFNCIFSVAVFHHFPKEYAKREAQELYRVTKKDGAVFVSVWNLFQLRFLKYFLSPGIILGKIFDLGDFSGLGVKDALIPFQDAEGSGETFDRFHHAFTQKELMKIFEEAGFLVQKAKTSNNWNVALIAKKK